MDNIVSTLNQLFIYRHNLKNTEFLFFKTQYIFLPDDNFNNIFLFSEADKTYIYFATQLNVQTFNFFLKLTKPGFDYIIIYEKITSECTKNENINKTIFLYNKDFFISNIYNNELSKKSYPIKNLNDDEKNELRLVYQSAKLNALQEMKLTPNLTILGIKVNDVIKFVRCENNLETIIYKKIVI